MFKLAQSSIYNLSQQKNLSLGSAETTFDNLFRSDKEGYFITALLMGLMSKGITIDELQGFFNSQTKQIPSIKTVIKAEDITENSGTGGDSLKTFNVSTAASIILAAEGIYIPKQSYFAVTGLGGSGDLFQEFGIDVFKTSNPIIIKKTLEKIRIVPYVANFLSNPKKIPGIINFLNKRGEIGLNFITPFHLAANLLAPIKIKKRVYGVYDENLLKLITQLLQRVGYERALIFHGVDGLDEVSNIGATLFMEFDKKKVCQYRLTPKDFGVKKSRPVDIKAQSRKGNVIDFLRVLYGKDRGAKRDIVLVNSSVSFYVMNKVKNFKDGVFMAAESIDSGKARIKLAELVRELGDLKKLRTWEIKSGVV